MREIIECLIRIGKSTREIQEKIDDFPIIITTEYFKKLGFDEVEAIKLKWMLKRNDRKEEEEEKAAEGRRELLKESSYIFSENANPNFVLMDTCVLGFQKGRELLDKSKKVVVIDSVLEEMEKLLSKIKKKELRSYTKRWLWIYLKRYKKRMSEQKNKYIKKSDIVGEMYNYTDDRILTYLKRLPEESRPTLLTADINLANRADCFGLEYILVVNQTIKTKNPNKRKKKEVTSHNIQTIKINNKQEEMTKLNILGVYIKLKEGKTIIKQYCLKTKGYFVKDNQIQIIKQQDENEIIKFDYIVLVLRPQGKRGVKIVKIIVENKQIKYEEKIVKILNEIYQIKMPEEIQDVARNILIG